MTRLSLLKRPGELGSGSFALPFIVKTGSTEMLAPGGKACLEDVFAHLDTVVQKFGPKCVGIGSNYCGFDFVTEGVEDITGITALIDIMLNHGYAHEDINDIMGRNWLRIYESYLNA